MNTRHAGLFLGSLAFVALPFAQAPSEGDQGKPGATPPTSREWCMDVVDLPCNGSNMDIARQHAPRGVNVTCSPAEKILISGPCDKVVALRDGLAVAIRGMTAGGAAITAEASLSAELVAVTSSGERILRVLSLGGDARAHFNSVGGSANSLVHLNLGLVKEPGRRRLDLTWSLCAADKSCSQGEVVQELDLATAVETVLVVSDANTASSLGAALGLPDTPVTRLVLRITAAS